MRRAHTSAAHGVGFPRTSFSASASPRCLRSYAAPGPSRASRSRGRYFRFHDVHLVPRPFQQPHPPIRIAASSPETFEALGTAGYPIFVGARAGTLSQLVPQITAYRQARRAAGHPGEGQVYLRLPIYVAGHPGNGEVYLRLPIYVAETRELALDEPQASLMSFYQGFARRLGDSVGRSGVVDADERASLRCGSSRSPTPMCSVRRWRSAPQRWWSIAWARSMPNSAWRVCCRN